MTKPTKRKRPQKSPEPVIDPARVLPGDIVGVLRIQATSLELLLRKHNADLAAHTRAIEAALEPIQKALEKLERK